VANGHLALLKYSGYARVPGRGCRVTGIHRPYGTSIDVRLVQPPSLSRLKYTSLNPSPTA